MRRIRKSVNTVHFMFSLTLVIEIIHSKAENNISYNFVIKNNSCKNIFSLKSTKKKKIIQPGPEKQHFKKKCMRVSLSFPTIVLYGYKQYYSCRFTVY